jgi:hypothetical protein
LASVIPALGATDAMAGKTAWKRDPFKRDQSLDRIRNALNECAKDTLNWLFLLTQSNVFYFVKNLVEPELRADITKRISEANASNKIMLWQIFKPED